MGTVLVLAEIPYKTFFSVTPTVEELESLLFKPLRQENQITQ